MAGVIDRFKKKKGGQNPEWSRNGSFLNKPEVGWIHPDQQLAPDAGICYGVRYIGNVEVKESMKSLDFDTRTQVAREAINRVAEAAGLKTATKKRKVDKRVSRMLGEIPHMNHAGANVNLTITTDSINLMVMETGEIIADHPMHVVSFASGGDAETLDFVSYVAKDPALGRACHVLECGGGLAEDVVTTVGQAFELRFKQYLQKQPKAVQIPDRRENPSFEGEKWGEEEEYYNDRPGACPPSPGPEGAAPPIPPIPEYNSPCNVPVGQYMSVKDKDEDGVYSEAKGNSHNLIDFSDTSTNVYDNRQGVEVDDDPNDLLARVYDNRSGLANGDSNQLNPFDFGSLTGSLGQETRQDGGSTVDRDLMEAGLDMAVGGSDPGKESAAASSGEIDLRQNPGASTDGPSAPVFEEWYHGKIGRKEAEKLLELDGDFLVREASNSSTQFVLSGKQSGNVRHLLLVDPDGIVRTKDFIFDSVSHLINYHRQNSLPIITEGSELRLIRPIKTCITAI
ncbi:SHC-transforming protein 1-like [Babylonia areolata]|uniref:SHC-transforming protein 1-like n=1 Tax=Babylonia areolata TaxID=304850 RepID=UPI003FD3345B